MSTLTNRKNTRIVSDATATRLFHHGHNTATVYHGDHATRVELDDCGYDTVTTRRKINAFLDLYAPYSVALVRRKGETFLARWSTVDGWHDTKRQNAFYRQAAFTYS